MPMNQKQATEQSSPDRDQVEVLAEEFLERFRQGERPAVSEYTARHPNLADEIRDLFPALVMMEDVRPAPDDAPSVPAAEQLDLKQLGDFRIIREVGRGGMGIVYEAEQVSLGRRVALKVLPKQTLLDSKHKQRFIREAKAAARLHHTNIVPVFGVGQQDGLHYYVMQFIHGLGLDEVLVELQRLREEGPGTGELGIAVTPARDVSAVAVAQSLISGRFERTLLVDSDSEASDQLQATTPPSRSTLNPQPSTVDTAVAHLSDTFAVSAHTDHNRKHYSHSVARIGLQAAQALQYAHDQGIVHRDVKPGNLLLDTRGSVWVTDFGLAKAADQQDLTRTGDVLGTLRYMAPEQFDGKADARSDVFSLGLTLYELLAFKPAFNERDRHKLIKQVTTGTPPRLRTLDPHTPRDLETIVHKAIDRDPSHRYQTADELAADLQRYLGDEPIRAKWVSPVTRFARWCRRQPAAAALTIMIIVLSVTSVGAASVAMVQRERRVSQATEKAITGLSEARILMANEKYADAQSQLTQVKTQLAGEPALLTRFTPELEAALQQAELQLRLDRFNKTAAEARFTANPIVLTAVRTDFQRLSREQGIDQLHRAQRECRAALDVLQLWDNHRLSEHLHRLPFSSETIKSVSDAAAELLFLYAHAEFRLHELDGDSDAHVRKAIDILNQVLRLQPNRRSLYTYRSIYWATLGDDRRARVDEQRAREIPAEAWLDHVLLAHKLFSERQLKLARQECEAAISLKVNDYWTWMLWCQIHAFLRDNEQGIFGASICIGLCPEEPTGWCARGKHAIGLHRWDDAIADIHQALSLDRPDSTLRVDCFQELGSARWQRALCGDSPPDTNDLELALADFTEALRLSPNEIYTLHLRAACYAALGDSEHAEQDAHLVLRILEGWEKIEHYRIRASAYHTMQDYKNAVLEYIRLFNTGRNADVIGFDQAHLEPLVRQLEQQLEIEEPGDALKAHFVRCMAYWYLENKEKAQACYEQAVALIDTDDSIDEETESLRRQAETLLGTQVP